eukprot:6032956-Prymnesium_polylepis.1
MALACPNPRHHLEPTLESPWPFIHTGVQGARPIAHGACATADARPLLAAVRLARGRHVESTRPRRKARTVGENRQVLLGGAPSTRTMCTHSNPSPKPIGSSDRSLGRCQLGAPRRQPTRQNANPTLRIDGVCVYVEGRLGDRLLGVILERRLVESQRPEHRAVGQA